LKTENIPRSYLESERKERIGAVIGLESLAKLRGKRSSALQIFDYSFEASQARPKLQLYMIQQVFITREPLIEKASTSRTHAKLTRQKPLEKKKDVLGSKNLKQLKFTKTDTGPE